MKNKKKAVAGAMVIILAVAGFFLLKYFHKVPAQRTQQNYGAGVIKLSEVLKVHPRYNDLMKLYGERTIIAAQLMALPKDSAIVGELPNELNNDFTDLAQQKSEMGVKVINEKLQNEMIDKEKQLRAQIAEAKNADIKVVTDKYENAIFNCSLKLDNAESMRLTPNQIETLQQEMARLKKERFEKIRAVGQSYENYVQGQLGTYYAQRLQYYQSNLSAEQANVLAQANEEKKAFADNKEKMMKEQTKKLNENRMMYLTLYKKYTDKNNEIRALRESMIDDIASKVSMFAVANHLDIVYVDREDVANEIVATDDDWDAFLGEQLTVSPAVRDITSEITAQMQDAN